MLDGALVLLGGLLLIIPGFITDVVGLALLLAPTRGLARARRRRATSRAASCGRRLGSPARPGSAYDVDSTATDIDRPQLHAMTAVGGDDQVRTLSFGDVDGTVWGAALTAGSRGALVVGDLTGQTAHFEPGAGQLARRTARSWRLAVDGVELQVEPAAEEGDSPPRPDGGAPASGGSGAVPRARRGLPGAVSSIASTAPGRARSSTASRRRHWIRSRAVTGWFAPDEAFTLLALRAPRGKGQESDLVAATLFDPEGWIPVADPRLSTTYDGAGVPTRVNLELWVSEGENEFPRRAAGEAAGNSAVGDGRREWRCG